MEGGGERGMKGKRDFFHFRKFAVAWASLNPRGGNSLTRGTRPFFSSSSSVEEKHTPHTCKPDKSLLPFDLLTVKSQLQVIQVESTRACTNTCLYIYNTERYRYTEIPWKEWCPRFLTDVCVSIARGSVEPKACACAQGVPYRTPSSRMLCRP